MENNNNGGLPVTEPVVNTENSNATTTIETSTTSQPAAQTATQTEQKIAATETTQNNEPKKPTSILNAEDNSKYWSDDWKDKASAGDEKMKKWFEKFKTPNDALKAYKELETKFSKTRPLPELAKDATPEQIKEYREQAGIPESWEKYDTNLDGVVINDFDKPLVDEFLQNAHNKNLKPSEVKSALQAYFEVATKRNAEMIKTAESQTAEVQQSLQKEWGSLYKDNISMISTHLSNKLGPDVVEKLNSAALADGTLLINNPALLNYFLGDAKANNMSHTLTPNTQQYTSLLERKAEIEKIQREAPNTFYNNNTLSEEYNKINQALKNRNS